MHCHAFHYKGLMAGIVPVYLDREDAEGPVVAERHWTLLPAVWLVTVVWLVGEGLWNLVSGKVFTEEPSESGMWFRITGYIDPPVYFDCRCDESDDG